MLKTQAEIISDYTSKIDTIKSRILQTKKLVDKLSLMRIALFLLEIAFFILLLNSADDGWRTLIQIGLVLPVILFAFVVKKQSKLDKVIYYDEQLLWVFQNEWNILNSLTNGYDSGQQFESELHPYSSDLDIFGQSSLYGLLNRCYTKRGKILLAKKLAEKTTINIVRSRQIAVKEMLAKIDSTYSFRANLHGHDIEKIELIKSQLSGQLNGLLSFVRNSFIKWCVTLAPYISIILILSALFIDAIFWNVLSIYFIINIGWNVLLATKVNKVFYSFGGNSTLLNGYANAISWTENQQWSSEYLKSLVSFSKPISSEILALSKIIQHFDARLNILVGTALNALLLWDLKCCLNLNNWHQSSSINVISALDTLGDFEELISLATTAYNFPDWAFPEIVDDFKLYTAAIGHPLIPQLANVVNDFSLEGQPSVDIVTGSNMAGKSTFLRTIGINMILAYSGAPVCAKKMELSIFSLNSYMRIKDSLNESTSTFKAELNRLKMILDNVVNDKSTFVLIDEMLRGTNSHDKYLGSKVFIKKLITEKTPALFATHDLQLSELKNEHEKMVRNFHFDIQIKSGEMMFDYKLKQGPCSTFNAALLLKEIGLALD